MEPAPSAANEHEERNRKSNEALDMMAPLVAAMGKAESLPLRRQDEALLEGLETFRFGAGGSRQAWSIGEGHLVVLVHGYSGRGVQMATIARRLAAEGYRCVFFDAGGHGASRPEQIGFFTFINDTRDILERLDTPVHALIGHSAGALGMMRARNLYGVSAAKYGVICAPLFPYVPLETIRARGAPEQVIDHVKAILSFQFQMGWLELVRGGAFNAEPDKPLLAIYDTADKTVRHTDTDALAAIWPDSRIIKTDGYGHNRILQAEETLNAVTKFLRD